LNLILELEVTAYYALRIEASNKVFKLWHSTKRSREERRAETL